MALSIWTILHDYHRLGCMLKSLPKLHGKFYSRNFYRLDVISEAELFWLTASTLNKPPKPKWNMPTIFLVAAFKTVQFFNAISWSTGGTRDLKCCSNNAQKFTFNRPNL